MRALAERIGLYRVAAVFVGGALVLEILSVEVLDASRVARVACTLGEVVLVALAAWAFLTARRRTPRGEA